MLRWFLTEASKLERFILGFFLNIFYGWMDGWTFLVTSIFLYLISILSFVCNSWSKCDFWDELVFYILRINIFDEFYATHWNFQFSSFCSSFPVKLGEEMSNGCRGIRTYHFRMDAPACSNSQISPPSFKLRYVYARTNEFSKKYARSLREKKKDGMKRNESVKREKTRLVFTWRGEIRMEGE